MPSFNNPKVTNPINSDVSEIRELLKIVAKQDYTMATDLPEGAKRLAAVSGGVQLQNFSNNSWSSIGKLMHDVDKLDGYHASTTATKGTIPVYNASAQLPGSITGNAATATKLASKKTIDIGGIATADAVGFDGSGNITIPINSINVTNTADNALIGIVSKAHGGTGRNDGAATDVILANGGKASEYGQIGYSKDITGISLDTLVEPGDYISHGMSIENRWPYSNPTSIGRVRVSRSGSYISQLLFCGGETLWQRVSTNTGASWGKLEPSGGNRGSSITIYISKSGNDNNTGMDKAHPVLTINRALKIADGWKPTQLNTAVKLCLGEGDWGDASFSSLPYFLCIYPYDGVAATSYSESLPKFGTLSFLGAVHAATRGVVADVLDANSGAFVDISNSVTRFGQLRSRYSATIEIYKSTLEVMNTDASLDPFNTYHGGRIVVGSASTCKVTENISVDTAFLSMSSCSDILNLEAIAFSVASGAKVTGRKYAIASGASVHYATKSFLDKLPGTTAGVLSNGVVVNGVPYGGGASDEALMADLSWKPVLLQTGGTMTGDVTYRSSVLDDSKVPSTILSHNPIGFLDKNGWYSAGISVYNEVNGYKTIQIRRMENNANDSCYVNLSINNGNKYMSTNAQILTIGANPPDDVRGTEVITAAWANKNIGNKINEVNDKLANYLPRNGTYSLNYPTSEFGVGVGTAWNNAPSFTLYGVSRTDGTAGAFAIRAATSESNRKDLVGKASGQLTWVDKNIVRSVNGKSADINGNVSDISKGVYTIGIINPSNEAGTWVAAPSGYTANVNCWLHACMLQQRVDDDDKIICNFWKEGNGWRVQGYTHQRNGDGSVIYTIFYTGA